MLKTSLSKRIVYDTRYRMVDHVQICTTDESICFTIEKEVDHAIAAIVDQNPCF